jgi:hypothetical protein
MLGMSATTGKPLSGEAHLTQSVGDILGTRIGTRVGRRDYGSLVPDLIDSAMNAAGRLRLFAASAIAIARWEPRLRVTAFGLEGGANGAFSLTIDAVRLDVAQPNAATRLTVPIRSA